MALGVSVTESLTLGTCRSGHFERSAEHYCESARGVPLQLPMPGTLTSLLVPPPTWVQLSKAKSAAVSSRKLRATRSPRPRDSDASPGPTQVVLLGTAAQDGTMMQSTASGAVRTFSEAVAHQALGER